MLKALEKLLEFLDKHLPMLLVGVFLGSKAGKRQAFKAKAKLFEYRYKLKRYELYEKARKLNDSLSNDELYQGLLKSVDERASKREANLLQSGEGEENKD